MFGTHLQSLCNAVEDALAFLDHQTAPADDPGPQEPLSLAIPPQVSDWIMNSDRMSSDFPKFH